MLFTISGTLSPRQPLDLRTVTLFTLDLSRQRPDLLSINVAEDPPFVVFDEEAVVGAVQHTLTAQGERGADREGSRYLAIYASNAAAARSLADGLQQFARTCREWPSASTPAGDTQAATPSAPQGDLAGDSPSVSPQPPPPPAEPVPAPERAFNLRAVINDPDGYTNVRSTGSTSGAILSQVVDGEVFDTYGQEGRWWVVRTRNGVIGYVHVSRIRLID